MCAIVLSSSASSTADLSSRLQADDGLMNGERDPVASAEALPAMPDIYNGFTFYDLTTQMEDGRYMARAAVVGRSEGRTLSQRFLDFETFDTEANASARAQAGARAWIDEEKWEIPLALPTYYTAGFMSERKAESVVTSK